MTKGPRECGEARAPRRPRAVVMRGRLWIEERFA